MSEQGARPEVLPGDLITRPGLYESRGGDIVQITGWDKGWWVSDGHGTVDWYGSDGRQRFDEGPEPNRWDLLHWVGPLPASEVEPETTSEQLAEIEGQAEPVQVCEGRWRTRHGDIRNVTPTPEGDGREERFPWWDAHVRQTWRANGRYHFGEESPLDLVEHLGPIEPQPEPQPPAEPVQVREGRWKTRGGEVKDVTAMPTDHDDFAAAFPWWDAQESTWTHSGHLLSHGACAADLVAYLGPIEPQQEPQPPAEPVQVREGRWRTRGEQEVEVTAAPTDHDDFSPAYPWWDGDVMTWANDGRFAVHENAMDLVAYLGPIEPEIGWQAEAIGRLQAEAIGRLQGEAHVLNMEIGGLERQLMQRDARIRDLETLHAAATQAVVDAGKQNDALRLQVQNRQNKQLDQKDAQIRDLQIELDAAQQVPRPVSDDERERIWDDATEQAGRQVIRWLRPLTDALSKQPDARFCRFMTLTLSVLPDIVPELLGYAVEDGAEGDCEE